MRQLLERFLVLLDRRSSLRSVLLKAFGRRLRVLEGRHGGGGSLDGGSSLFLLFQLCFEAADLQSERSALSFPTRLRATHLPLLVLELLLRQLKLARGLYIAFLFLHTSFTSLRFLQLLLEGLDDGSPIFEIPSFAPLRKA